jgi:hypothetical protein
MQIANTNIIIEETPQWQKIVLPAERNWYLLAFYSVAMLIWLAMLGIVVVGLFQPLGIERPFISGLVWKVVLVFWLVVWLFFARRWLWRNWQYYAAGREILFVNPEEFVVRRPVSVFGITNVYDMSHIDHVYLDPEEGSPSFQYGVRPVHFARGVVENGAQELVSLLNHRYFPQEDDDDDEF